MIKKDNMSREPMNFPNDLRAFLDEAWRHLQRGVADSRSPARYPTFATVAADGTPEARTVALRGASRSQSMLEVHTDIAYIQSRCVETLSQSRFSRLVATREFTNSGYNNCGHPDGVSC